MATTGLVAKGVTNKGVTVYASDTGLGAGTVTSSAVSGMDQFTSANFVVDATLAGTAPTLDVYLQTKLPNGDWTDIAHFTQLTATGKSYFSFVNAAATADAVIQDAALTAGSKTGVLGDTIRVKGVIAGTAPSGCSFTVYGSFYAKTLQ